MTTSEILALMDRFERSGLTTLRATLSGDTLELSRAAAAPAPVVSTAPGPIPAAAPAPVGDVIRAPLVGTFYAASAPDQPPFVQPGDRVSQGQTVCLIEAMKMMSEVPAPFECVIEEVLESDGALLGFDQPIFRCRKV